MKSGEVISFDISEQAMVHIRRHNFYAELQSWVTS